MKDFRLQQGDRIGIEIKGNIIGADTFTIIAGPCTIKDKSVLQDVAGHLKKSGIKFLRGGSFKMRTSPYSFQGIGVQALKYLHDVGEQSGMITVSEIVSENDIPLMSEQIDIIQVGTRNMQNYPLLKKLGKVDNPVILKRFFNLTPVISSPLIAGKNIGRA